MPWLGRHIGHQLSYNIRCQLYVAHVSVPTFDCIENIELQTESKEQTKDNYDSVL